MRQGVNDKIEMPYNFESYSSNGSIELLKFCQSFPVTENHDTPRASPQSNESINDESNGSPKLLQNSPYDLSPMDEVGQEHDVENIPQTGRNENSVRKCINILSPKSSQIDRQVSQEMLYTTEEETKDDKVSIATKADMIRIQSIRQPSEASIEDHLEEMSFIDITEFDQNSFDILKPLSKIDDNWKSFAKAAGQSPLRNNGSLMKTKAMDPNQITIQRYLDQPVEAKNEQGPSIVKRQIGGMQVGLGVMLRKKAAETEQYKKFQSIIDKLQKKKVQ